MDTDNAMQVLNAHSVNLGGNNDDVKNSDRKSLITKIWTKFEFGHDDVMDPKTIRYRFMALSDAIVKATKGDFDSIYLATIDELIRNLVQRTLRNSKHMLTGQLVKTANPLQTLHLCYIQQFDLLN
jgi:hypothetical protein